MHPWVSTTFNDEFVSIPPAQDQNKTALSIHDAQLHNYIKRPNASLETPRKKSLSHPLQSRSHPYARKRIRSPGNKESLPHRAQ